MRFIVILSIFVSLLPPTQDVPTLEVMQTQVGLIENESAEALWRFEAEFDVTILVKTIEGTLDPVLEALDDNGAVIATSMDIASAFATDASLSLPGDRAYTIRVTSGFGTGRYEIAAVPGVNMWLTWQTDFATPNPDWGLTGANIRDEALALESPFNGTRTFTPTSAPRGAEIYLQGSFTWVEARDDSLVGFIVRERPETTGQSTAVHFLAGAGGVWRVQTTDINGEVEIIDSGSYEPTAVTTLGFLAQGDVVSYFINGELVGVSEYPAAERQELWAVELVNGNVTMDDFLLALPTTAIPEFPETLENWDTIETEETTSELIDAELIAEDGQRRLFLPNTSYQVSGSQRRTYLIGQTNDLFADAALSVTVDVSNGTDIGCGIAARYQDDDNQTFIYADTQGGVGLLWWENGLLQINNYTLLEDFDPTGINLVLIVKEGFAGFYADGILVAQNLIAERVGGVGLGVLNYADTNATCRFRNFWVWG